MTIEELSTLHNPSEEDITEMTKLMSDGKRNLICQQPELALGCFVDLCEKMSKHYGQESEKCIDAYLHYGKTLLDIARIENGVLGHAVKGTQVLGTETETEDEGSVKDVITEDEDEICTDEIKNKVVEAMREENLYNESTDGDTEEEEEEDGAEPTNADVVAKETTVGDEENKDGAGSSEAETTVKTDGEPTAEEKMDVSLNQDDGVGDDQEDVTNMELAWEMLELTTVICRRQLMKDGDDDDKTLKSTIAEAKHCLAQISLEAERHEDAVNDFKECLAIHEEISEEKNDRLIAEAHYNIALAFSFDKKYPEAIEEFEVCLTLLKARVEDLERNIKDEESKAENERHDHFEDWTREVYELNDLVVFDMKAKIEGAKESKLLYEESLKTIKDGAVKALDPLCGSGFDEGFDSVDVKQPVHDCTGNMRSVKRMSDDESSGDVREKKSKNEDCPTMVVDTNAEVGSVMNNE